ncbi:MAG: transposase [Pseudomonadota bacterium]
MDAVAKRATPKPQCYRRRQHDRTLLYRTVQTHLATWLERHHDAPGRSAPALIEREFRRYLECGILAHGFARARCIDCGHDFLIAFSCKGRGVCPSCTTRRMVETAAHLVDHVIPRLPVRQWVLSVPKRLRYYLDEPAMLNAALHIFLHAVEQSLRLCSPGATAESRIGAVVFIHRFGGLLNPHLALHFLRSHFHAIVVDGVFAAGSESAEGVCFTEARLDPNALEKIHAQVRKRLLSAFVRRGLIEKDEAQTMRSWEHGGGFSLDAGVRIEGNDRQGLERLLRYCARPAFALERLRQIDAEHLVYESIKPGPGGSVSLILTPMELLDRLAALIPPPRRHRHRYYGVLAPNSPQREAVTALAAEVEAAADIPHAAGSPVGESLVGQAARYAWALLLARIYEVFPLQCPKCGSEMRIIAFIIEAQVVREILTHLGEPTSPPRMAPARGPPLWEAAMTGQSSNDPLPQPEPAYEFDQRIAW